MSARFNFTTMEKHIHTTICLFIRRYHPYVIFTTDMSGLRVSIGTAKQMKRLRSSNAIPDLIILEPRGGCHGLLIEIKRDDETIILLNGQLTADEHIREQSLMITRLRDRGYCAYFCRGVSSACNLIEKYLSGEILLDDVKRSTVEWMDSSLPGYGILKID